MSDKITVIVPVYNVQNYVAKCIESISSQTYGNLEILLVNDGSTDGSGAICENYAKSDDRIKVIHKLNGGLSDARNVGIEAATGKFIGFVDSDDWIDQDMYEMLHNLIIEHQADISLCKLREISNVEVVDKSTDDLVVCDGLAAIGRMLTKDKDYRFNHGVTNKLIKRELLKNIRFPVGLLTEDLYFTPKLFYASKKCVYRDKAKYNYLSERSGSIMNTEVHEKIIWDELNGIKEIEHFLNSKNIREFDFLIKEFYLNRLMYYYCSLKSSAVENKEQLLSELIELFMKNADKESKSLMKAKAKTKISLFHFSPSFYYQSQEVVKKMRRMKKSWRTKNDSSRKLLNEIA